MEALSAKRGSFDDPQADAALVARCKTGERAAFNELMVRYEKRVYNYAYRLCGNYDDANDITADAFVRVYNAIGNFRGDSSFVTWLFRIVTNVYLDARKRHQSRPTQSLEALVELEETSVVRQVEDPSPTPYEQAANHQRTDLLSAAISALPEYQRMMIVLYHTESRSYEEIADLLGLPIGTVKSRLNRARLSLREALLPLQEQFPV